MSEKFMNLKLHNFNLFSCLYWGFTFFSSPSGMDRVNWSHLITQAVWIMMISMNFSGNPLLLGFCVLLLRTLPNSRQRRSLLWWTHLRNQALLEVQWRRLLSIEATPKSVSTKKKMCPVGLRGQTIKKHLLNISLCIYLSGASDLHACVSLAFLCSPIVVLGKKLLGRKYVFLKVPQWKVGGWSSTSSADRMLCPIDWK